MTILLSYVPSEPGDAAAPVAIAEAAAHGVPLVIVNALRGGALVDSHAASDEALTSLVEQARAAGVDATVERPENTDIVEAILELAEKDDVSTIVIGVRHRSPVGKLLLGSVAQRVILEAPCAVLAVKPQA